jgi:hypothetical protein
LRVIKLRRIKWADGVAWMGEAINAYKISVASPTGKGPLGDIVIMFFVGCP